MHPSLRSLVLLLCCYLPCSAAETDAATDNLAELVQNQTEFAFSCYSAIDSDPSSNTLFSPYSLSTCLSMVFLGAREDTADEIQNTLHLKIDRDQVAATSLALAQKLESKSKEAPNYQLQVANAIWVDQQTFILSEYAHTLESSFRAKIDRINFQKADKATATINQWISDQTGAKITNLLSPADLNEQTRLVLTNAVYFQGSFVSPFDEKQTKKTPFYPTPDTTSSVAMMQQTGSFPYLENDLFQMLSLPFVDKNGAKMALAILLPKSTDNLPQIEDDLDHTFQEWLPSLQTSRVIVQLPKFTLKKRLDFNQTLQQMGMKIPFTTEANFSGIDGKLDLYLSKVIHEALFALDEAGVVAAAATAAGMNKTSAQPAAAPTPFIADHPFLFFIIDMTSREILFMGKFQEPKDVL